MSLRTLLIGASFCLIVISSATAASVSLNPSQDSTLFETASNNQKSTGVGDIFVGRINAASLSIRRGLVQFDLSTANIPTGATITSAQLTLFAATVQNGSPTLELHRALVSWGEGTSSPTIPNMAGMGATPTDQDVTWFYRFYSATSPSTWNSPGGGAGTDYSTTVSATSTSSNISGGQLFTLAAAQLAIDIQSMLSNSSQNFGWFIFGNENAQQTAQRLNSGESGSMQPTLTIVYSVAEPSTLGLAVLSILVPCRLRRSALRKRTFCDH